MKTPEKTVVFGRPRGPHDYLKMRHKALRYLMLGTILVGQLTLSMWFKQERLVGAQRQLTFVEKIEKGKKFAPEIIAVNVYFTASGSYSRDGYLPGWNASSNTVDCIGGGGGGGGSSTSGYAGSGGGGGGLARYTNLGALPATIPISVAPGGGGGGPNGAGGAGGNTDFGGWVGAYGGGGGSPNGNGGAGGTYYAGTGYYAGGAGGGATGFATSGGGGGGGAAGRYGGGSAGQPWNVSTGGNGGPSGGGAGAGSAGTGGNGNEYQSGVGSGGGGGGTRTQAHGGPGGYYGGGGGGGMYYSAAYSGGAGRPGLVAVIYTPLTAPVVSSCTPNIGPTIGGTAVTIGGSGFINVTSVAIGGVAATSLAVPNASTITCVTPAHAVGLVSIVVNVSGGVAAGTGANLFTYLPPSGGFNMPMPV